MANPERGEVALMAGAKEYTLALSMNGICEMQTRTGRTYGDLLRAMPLDFVAFRDIVWMALKRHHAREFPDASAVGTFIDALPDGHATAAKAIRQLLELNAERGRPKKDGETADPPTAQN